METNDKTKECHKHSCERRQEIMATLDINNDKLITLENLKQFKGKIYNYVDDNRVMNVNFSLEVDDNGNLVAVYPDGTEAPGLSIDENGYLVYNSEV